MQLWVRYLASLSGLRIPHCCGCGVGRQLQLQLDSAWEPPHATGAALKRQKKKKRLLGCLKALSRNYTCPFLPEIPLVWNINFSPAVWSAKKSWKHRPYSVWYLDISRLMKLELLHHPLQAPWSHNDTDSLAPRKSWTLFRTWGS